MPVKLNLDLDWDLQCKPTSRQIGNVKSNVYETYMVPKNGKPVLTDKSVETYYVDKYGNRASIEGKKSEYHYNNDGTLKNATIQRERPGRAVDTFVKNKSGSGKWFNAEVKTNFMTAYANEKGITSATFNSRYFDKASVDALPANIKKMVLDGLDFIMQNIKKVK